MRRRAAGGLIGVVFGITLCWSGMSSPVVIRQALLFEKSYLFLFFASAVATTAIGLRILRARQQRALLVNTPLTWTPERPERRHVVGAVVFGIGWGVADACPGPIATQVGQGIAWSLFTLAGVGCGIYVYLRRRAVETEPSTQPAPAHGAARPVLQPSSAPSR